MEPISLIIGVGIIAFILAYMAFQLDQQHWPLKILLIFFTVYMLLLIPKTILDYPPNCSTVITNQTINEYQMDSDYKINVIQNTYGQYCGEEKNAPAVLLKNVLRIQYVMLIYLTIFSVYFVFRWLFDKIKKKLGIMTRRK